jgi:hypothetical protein
VQTRYKRVRHSYNDRAGVCAAARRDKVERL